MNRDSLAIPGAIVIAAALIAGAIYLGGNDNSGPSNVAGNNDGRAGQNAPLPTEAEPVVEPVGENDHIRGNPNADILIVEYSDYDCPFCKDFHVTMSQVIDEYGADGRVAWVYRHFPLVQLHPNAPRISEASECVAELGGNDAFWTFSDLVFGERGQREPTDLNRLGEFAQTAGVDVGQFELCLNSGKYQEQIAQDIEEAIAAGGRGTPHSVVLVGDQQGVINGAQEFPAVKQIIDNLLTQLDGQAATPEEG